MEPKLDISPDFTIEDIKKIREYHYEVTKDMTTDERRAFYKEGTEKACKRMAELREEKKRTNK
ncbi:MAG: hypothetical protein FWG98_07625 [Candidatus Cloacimonetes bacterium]|nr:hypothetical protein [Candidatus Cloacimonadota bacterium]